MRFQWTTIRRLVAGAALAATTMGVTAGSAFALSGGGTDPGSGGGGTPAPAPAPAPDNTVSFYGNSYLGYGHGQTASGFLDRTTSTLYATTQTTAGWCGFGWHGASQVIIDDQYGHMIWASGELGPTGVDGGCFTTNKVNVSYPPIPVPAAVASHAAEIDVFNFWDPQWTGVTKVLNAIGSLTGPVWSYCTSNPSACIATAAGVFAPML